MPFVAAARARVANLPKGSEERIILEFLLNNGVGRANAQPWNQIEAHLAAHGITMSQQKFQQGLLKETRENDIFIGSNDHGHARGYFLIEDISDAEMMRDWYTRRMRVEKSRLDNLKKQSKVMGWVM